METEVKVLTICTVEMGRNGISTFIMNCFQTIHKNIVRMDFVAPAIGDSSISDFIKDMGSDIYELNMRNRNPYRYFVKLVHLIRKKNYDIVHVHGNSRTVAVELLAAKTAGCRVRIAHSHNTNCNHYTAHALLRPVFEISCTHRFACGREAGIWMFKKNDFLIINNGIRTENFIFSRKDRASVRNSLQLTDEFVIGHIGLFNEQKNHEFIIRVFASCLKEIENCKLLLVGNGRNYAVMKEKARKLKIEDKVIFYGQSDEVTKLLSAMDLFLFPSKFEGFGIALMEAQITGMPCIASNAVPESTAMGDRVYYLGLDESTDKWVEMIRRLKAEKWVRESFYQENNARIRSFDILNTAEYLEKLYLSFVRKRDLCVTEKIFNLSL